MDRYAGGFVPVDPTDDRDAYTDLGRGPASCVWITTWNTWRPPERTWGEDSLQRFHELADAGPDDSVVFASTVYESREHRDEVNKQVMADMDADESDQPMPFDPGKMADGGFRELVRLES
jgi:uncharacterized protein YbaA (DUF1428 family)